MIRLTIAHRKAVAVAFTAAVQAWRAGHQQEAVAAALAVETMSARQRRRAAVDRLDWPGLHGHITDHVGPHIAGLYDRSWADAQTETADRWGDAGVTRTPNSGLLVSDRADVLADSTWDGANTVAAMVIAAHLDPWAAAGVILAVAGLNRPQAVSVANYRKALTVPPKGADGAPGKPLGTSIVDRRTQRQADAKLRRRGTLVGWYEPAHAVGLGRLDAWRHYGTDGGFDQLEAEGLKAVREWVVGVNPCDDCGAMAGVQVPYDEEFPGGSPPRHPACQCHDVLTVVEADLPLGAEGIGWQREHTIDGDRHFPTGPLLAPTAAPERRAA